MKQRAIWITLITLAAFLLLTACGTQDSQPGPQGDVGPQGAVGPQEPVGPQGDVGPQGPVGPMTSAAYRTPVWLYIVVAAVVLLIGGMAGYAIARWRTASSK